MLSGIVTSRAAWELEQEQIVIGNEIVGYADALKVELELLREEVAVKAACAGEELWLKFENVTNRSKLVLVEMKQRGLALKVRPRVLCHTDKGPGVAITNYEVRFRDAELVRMYDLDWQMRVHYAVNDPCPAERTNACIGKL